MTMSAHRLMLIAIAIFVCLCAGFIQTTPYRTAGHLLSRMRDIRQGDIGAPDERQHANYARHIAGGEGFPVFHPQAADLYETYQSHQPPLYYLLCAPLARIANHNDEAEKWLLRLVNVLLGGITIWLVFKGITRFGGSEQIAVIAACTTAFLPMFVAISSAVTNDMALYLVVAILMNRIAAGWNSGWSWRNCILLGLVLGLGLLTKTSAILVFPVALAGLIMRNRPSLGKIAACFLIAFAIASPWLMRNQILYGDPLAIGAFRQASVGNLPASVAISELGAATYWFSWVGASAVKSLWGVFGYFDVYLSEALYRLLSAAAVLMLAGLMLSWKQMEPDAKAMHKLNALLFLFVLAGFISYNMNYYQAQARYLYPAIFSISAALATGIWALAGGERRRVWALGGLWILLLLGVDVFVLFGVLPDAFARMISPS
jgi:4-amino-4-deoxy-L-arabinose transferase-like glycosyltransferase